MVDCRVQYKLCRGDMAVKLLCVCVVVRRDCKTLVHLMKGCIQC